MIRGSLVPNITIFTEDGDLDLGRTKEHMRWMFGRGVDGLFPTGSYGAGPLMSAEERISVYHAAREVADEFDGKQIVAHVGTIDPASAVKLARGAQAAGADAVGAVPPFYYKASDAAVIDYYRGMIEAVDIPVFAYNNPATTRYTFTLPVVKKLMDAGLAGLKDSPLNVQFLSGVYYTAQQEGRDFEVILGTSTGWLPFHLMGVQAMFAGTNNWAPELVTELVRASFGGELDRARDVYLVMEHLSHLMHFTDSTIASHMALEARGFASGFPRKPMILPPATDSKYADIRRFLEEAFATLGIRFED